MSEAQRPPGARLRSERERRGLSLQKAADEMRLDAWVIEALETDQYERIGPAVYAKGHLKKYAGILSIPWEEVVAAYDSLHVESAQSPAQAPAVRIHSPPPIVNNFPTGQIAVAVIFALIVAGVIWWKPWQQRNAASSSTPPTTQVSVPVPRSNQTATDAQNAPADASQPTVVQQSAATAGSETAGVDQPAAGVEPVATTTAAGAASGSEAGAGRARLRLSFSADSWVDVHDAAGRRIFSGYGRANSVKVVAGDAPLRVYLGYASGVQLEINEHAVAIARPFVHGDVARFQAGADGVLRGSPNSAQPRG
jgi:cytoskeleton protein RodZ